MYIFLEDLGHIKNYLKAFNYNNNNNNNKSNRFWNINFHYLTFMYLIQMSEMSRLITLEMNRTVYLSNIIE